MLETITSYHLIYELILDGKAGVYPDIEPIATTAIVQELSQRSGWPHTDDALEWIEWFLTEDPTATAEQKLSLSSAKRIMTIERRALKKINNTPEAK